MTNEQERKNERLITDEPVELPAGWQTTVEWDHRQKVLTLVQTAGTVADHREKMGSLDLTPLDFYQSAVSDGSRTERWLKSNFTTSGVFMVEEVTGVGHPQSLGAFTSQQLPSIAAQEQWHLFGIRMGRTSGQFR